MQLIYNMFSLKSIFKLISFLTLCTAPIVLIAQADTSITTLNNVHQGNGNGLATRTVIDTFLMPQDISVYNAIRLHISLSCPSGGCDPWDRYANVSVYHETEWFEIARYITPYGKACGWITDVSDYRSMLKDTVILKSFIDTWTNPGWLVKLEFEFIAGTPLYENIKVENLWNNDNLVYGDTATPAVLPVVTKTIDPTALGVKLRMVNTGHGQGNTGNAAEFSQKTHSLYINGNLINTHLLWRTDCATNPCSPQSGTWQYNRAGWCPGADVLPTFFDLTSLVTPGQSVDLDYRLQYYFNSCSPANAGCVTGSTCADCNYNYNGHTEPHYKIAGQLITYESVSTGIKQQSSTDEFSIYPNPSNGLIRLKTKKTSSTGKIEVFDLLGNSVYNGKLEGDMHTVDLSNLSKGTYFLKYFSNDKTEIQRFIIQ